MANSQNGWPVVGPGAVIDRAVHGVEFPNGWLKGDVDVVFTHLIDRLHNEVEPIDRKTPRPPVTPGSCWGWFVKRIEGSSTISNHASGTAIDYNAQAHPMGVRNTYSATDRAKIRAILADLDGVVRWGGDYTGRPDDMHFEIHADRAAVARVADRIRHQEDIVEAADRTAIAKAVVDALAPRLDKLAAADDADAARDALQLLATRQTAEQVVKIRDGLKDWNVEQIAALIPAGIAEAVADELHARIQD